jgi:hypothetical protein
MFLLLIGEMELRSANIQKPVQVRRRLARHNKKNIGLSQQSLLPYPRLSGIQRGRHLGWIILSFANSNRNAMSVHALDPCQTFTGANMKIT